MTTDKLKQIQPLDKNDQVRRHIGHGIPRVLIYVKDGEQDVCSFVVDDTGKMEAIFNRRIPATGWEGHAKCYTRALKYKKTVDMLFAPPYSKTAFIQKRQNGHRVWSRPFVVHRRWRTDEEVISDLSETNPDSDFRIALV